MNDNATQDIWVKGLTTKTELIGVDSTGDHDYTL